MKAPTGTGPMANYLRKLADFARSIQIQPGPGYLVRRTPEGTFLEIQRRGGVASESSETTTIAGLDQPHSRVFIDGDDNAWVLNEAATTGSDVPHQANGVFRPGLVKFTSTLELDPLCVVTSDGASSSGLNGFCFESGATGDFFVCGNFATAQYMEFPCVAKITAEGNADSAFQPKATGGTIYSVFDDGTYLTVFGLNSYDSNTANGIAKIVKSDASFGSSIPSVDSMTAPASLNSICQNGTGWVVIASYTENGSDIGTAIVKLDSSLVFDAGFITKSFAGVFGAQPYAVAMNGTSVLVGGSFTTYDGNTHNYIVQLDGSADADAGFDAGTGLDGAVYSITPASGGGFWLCGAFTSYNGTTRSKLCKVAADGTLQSFDPPTFNGDVNHVGEQSTGNLVVVGSFTTVGGSTRNRICRLSSTGTLLG